MTIIEALKLSVGDKVRLKEVYICDDGEKLPAGTLGKVLDWKIPDYTYTLRCVLRNNEGFVEITASPEQMEKVNAT